MRLKLSTESLGVTGPYSAETVKYNSLLEAKPTTLQPSLKCFWALIVKGERPPTINSQEY